MGSFISLGLFVDLCETTLGLAPTGDKLQVRGTKVIWIFYSACFFLSFFLIPETAGTFSKGWRIMWMVRNTCWHSKWGKLCTFSNLSISLPFLPLSLPQGRHFFNLLPIFSPVVHLVYLRTWDCWLFLCLFTRVLSEQNLTECCLTLWGPLYLAIPSSTNKDRGRRVTYCTPIDGTVSISVG